jgi:hypothetical protein
VCAFLVSATRSLRSDPGSARIRAFRAKRDAVSLERSEESLTSPPKGGRDYSSVARWRRRQGRSKGVSSELAEGRDQVCSERSEHQCLPSEARISVSRADRGNSSRVRRRADENTRAQRDGAAGYNDRRECHPSPPKGGREPVCSVRSENQCLAERSEEFFPSPPKDGREPPSAARSAAGEKSRGRRRKAEKNRAERASVFSERSGHQFLSSGAGNLFTSSLESAEEPTSINLPADGAKRRRRQETFRTSYSAAKSITSSRQRRKRRRTKITRLSSALKGGRAIGMRPRPLAARIEEHSEGYPSRNRGIARNITLAPVSAFVDIRS